MENDDMANKPKRELFGAVRREGSEKDFWTRIGTAFENKDGSWNLLFDYFPTSPGATVQMREPKHPKPIQREAYPRSYQATAESPTS
jgi:hypothetical protein